MSVQTWPLNVSKAEIRFLLRFCWMQGCDKTHEHDLFMLNNQTAPGSSPGSGSPAHKVFIIFGFQARVQPHSTAGMRSRLRCAFQGCRKASVQAPFFGQLLATVQALCVCVWLASEFDHVAVGLSPPSLCPGSGWPVPTAADLGLGASSGPGSGSPAHADVPRLASVSAAALLLWSRMSDFFSVSSNRFCVAWGNTCLPAAVQDLGGLCVALGMVLITGGCTSAREHSGYWPSETPSRYQISTWGS